VSPLFNIKAEYALAYLKDIDKAQKLGVVGVDIYLKGQQSSLIILG
jgi:hypothetical protein